MLTSKIKSAFFVSIFLTGKSFLAIAQQTFEAPITNVKIYLSGAELTHQYKVKLKKGENSIVFSQLADGIDDRSIQVETGSSEVTLLMVNPKLNFIDEERIPQRLKSLTDSLENLTDKIAFCSNEVDALEKEATLLLPAESGNAVGRSTNPVDIDKIADHFRKRNAEILTLRMQKEKLIRQWENKKIRLNQQIQEESSRNGRAMNEIHLKIQASQDNEYTLTLHYYTYYAGWSPRYDIRGYDQKKELAIHGSAVFFNNSGKDWNKVNLSISTANPKIGLDKPGIQTENYDGDSDYFRTDMYNKNGQVKSPQALYNNQLYNQSIQLNTKNNIGTKTIEIPSLSFDYAIPQPYTVPSDAKPYTVEINQTEVSGNYIHYCSPSSAKSAYLLARISTSEVPNFISGDANIYYNNTYLGKTFFNTKEIEDSLDISFGPDKDILVQYKEKKVSYEYFFNSNMQKEKFHYEGTWKNNKKIPVTIIIEDDIPAENRNDVDVSIIDLSGGKHDINTGIVQWKLTLQPGETKQIQFIYSIKHPKNLKPHRAKFKAVSCPSFFVEER